VELVWRIAALTGATSVRALGGGHQSRVFAVDRPDGPLVAKVRRADDVDRVDLDARLHVVARLAEVDPWVCGPLPLDGALVTSLDADGAVQLVTWCELVEGRPPDPALPTDGALMGSVLARLHATMATVDASALPLVTAIRTVRPAWDGPTQLLHGDFSAANLRVTDGWCRIFDLDDCGLGPPAFDVANSLLMVQFDDMTGGAPNMYPAFEEAFVGGYQLAADSPLDLDEVHSFIDLRVDALERWLDDPTTAPIGIRRSPPEWHATLRRFVSDHRSRPRPHR
jgi:Ser/Thr protein kinase RdoA (MazF antagonist)